MKEHYESEYKKKGHLTEAKKKIAGKMSKSKVEKTKHKIFSKDRTIKP